MAHRFLAFAAAAVIIAASRMVAQGAGLNTQIMVAAPAVSVSPAPATVGTSVAITFTTSVSRTAPYGLDFGDTQQGAIAPGKPVMHAYAKAGTFQIRVLDGANIVAQTSLVVQGPFRPQLVNVAAMPASVASPSPAPWKLDVSQDPVLGRPVTFTLEAPTNVSESCPILFSDEQPGIGDQMVHNTMIQTRGTITHIYSRFGPFEVKVVAPCPTQLLDVVIPSPLPTTATHAEESRCLTTWMLSAVPSILNINEETMLVLCAPAHQNQTCKIRFGDEQTGPGAGPPPSSTVLARSTIRHRYARYGTFSVVVDLPCQAAPITVTVKPPA
jgi:hypothetical protein